MTFLLLRGLACLTLAVFVLPTHAADSGPSRTTNLRLTPQWTDAEQFTFRRETDSGETEWVRVDAATGEMTVIVNDEAKTENGRDGFLGGPVSASGPSDDSTELVLINRSGQPIQIFWVNSSGDSVAYEKILPGATMRRHTYAGHVWTAFGEDGVFYGSVVAQSPPLEAVIEKTFPSPKNKRKKRRSETNARPDLSFEMRLQGGQLQYAATPEKAAGDAGDSRKWMSVDLPGHPGTDSVKTLTQLQVSPDGKFASLWVQTPVDAAKVYTIESSPKDAGRANLLSQPYRLPGDEMDRFELVIVNTETWKAIAPEMPVIDFGWPKTKWRNGNQLLIEKVDRGHQRFRLFMVDPPKLFSSDESPSSAVRTVIDEVVDTFLWTAHGQPVPSVTYLKSQDRVIYASEKSGYRHLYFVTLDDDAPMVPITRGDFLVRKLIHVDETQGYLDLVVGEFHDDQDPYHQHLIRVSTTDGAITSLTDGDGDHEYLFSPDRRYVIVNHSRVDSPPVHELRRCADGKRIAILAEAKRVGRQYPLPTRFVAKGRDGKTDIWGLICFPKQVDPETAGDMSPGTYPVLEYIYAGPHDSHVPKPYRNSQWMTDMTDLGFIVVRIDGMGTANRSKAFHDVAWKNLKDAGFPDRMEWMKAAAKKYPVMDLSRVGIYGTSAGGQNACGALLLHGDFYKAAVASCGCHDNRMDKASWNEQWMGSDVGPHYAQCSNIDLAPNLNGDLFLIVGELDTNVPPESTYRLVDALIKADKRFKFLMIPGMGHSDGGDYGRQLTREFFVEKLKPPVAASVPAQPTKLDISASKLLESPPVPTWQNNARIYFADRNRLKRQFPVRIMPERLAVMNQFFDRWESVLQTVSAADLSTSESRALEQLSKTIVADRRALQIDREASASLLSVHPWISELLHLCDCRDRGLPINSSELSRNLSLWMPLIVTKHAPNSENLTDPKYGRQVAKQFADWRKFYADYHPEFDWWLGELSQAFQQRLEQWDGRVEIAPNVATPNPGVDVDSPVVMDDDYPASVVTLEQETRNMPAIIQRFRTDFPSRGTRDAPSQSAAVLGPWLTAWEAALTEIGNHESAFESWGIDDRVDYHLLKNQIKFLIATTKPSNDPSSQSPIIAKSLDGSGIEGVVVGRDRLLMELQNAQIDHTPEELIELAEARYEDCRAEIVKTSHEMGFGDDWQSAVEQIKTLHVEVGKQPELIRQLAQRSVDWIEQKDWLTIERLAQCTWRMEMMTPQRQLVNPFFTGGEVISVSFPTRQMSADDQRQSLRGNPQPYAVATVHHELIPGHHLQTFSNSRFQTHRQPFGSPFWLEGWAVYWEFLLMENGFAKTPEEKMGFLVWRAHRYTRILFSLRFHLGQLSPDQCVDFLIDNVGFDRRNAEGEIRRSVGPDYPPLYQAAYMLGAMQFDELADRWTEQKRGTLKEFHDAVLRQGSMPIASLEAILFEKPVQADVSPTWRFKMNLSKANTSEASPL